MSSRAVSESWRSEARSLEAADFLGELPEQAFTLLHGEGRFLILGEDPLFALSSPEELVSGSLLVERRGELPPILPDLLGHATYELGYRLDPVCAELHRAPGLIPDFRFVLHRRLRIFDRATGLLHTAEREAARELDPRPHALGRGAFQATKVEDSEDAASHMAKVARVREEIAKGKVYQVNLTRQEAWRFEGDLAEFARRLAVENPAPYSALMADPEWTILSSSPERFFRIEKGRISTCPIKGTAPRGADPAQDAALAEELLASPKNLSELAMIVDLLRNDLSRLSGGEAVRVEAFPRLESFANVHHLVAELSAALPGSFTLLELLRALFPGGSITGCPKLAAMALIRELEPWPRSIYTGMLGWFRADLGQAETAIAIRTAWAQGDTLRFGVGGGIVWDSDPAAEYEETHHKGRSLVRCLNS